MKRASRLLSPQRVDQCTFLHIFSDRPSFSLNQTPCFASHTAGETRERPVRRAVRRDMPVAASASFTYHNRTKRLAFGAPRICNSYRNAQIPAHLRVSAVARSRFGEPVSLSAPNAISTALRTSSHGW